MVCAAIAIRLAMIFCANSDYFQDSIARERRPRSRVVVAFALVLALGAMEPSCAWMVLNLGLARRQTRGLVEVIGRADRGEVTLSDNDTLGVAWLVTKEGGYMDLLDKIAASGSGWGARSAAWAIASLRRQYPQWF